MDNRFQHSRYLVRKKIFKLFGDAFHIFDPDGNVVFYSKLKAFKLREDIRLYTGEDMQNEVLAVKARQILDFSAAYDVFDSTSGMKVGTLKRRGFKSMFKDEWIIMDADEREIGTIKEDSLIFALIRRFILAIFPQTFTGEINGQQVCEFRQNFNPFVTKINVDFTPDHAGALDKRLGLAAAILLCAIEGKQE